MSIVLGSVLFLLFFLNYIWCYISACKFMHAYFIFIIQNGCHAGHVLVFQNLSFVLSEL